MATIELLFWMPFGPTFVRRIGACGQGEREPHDLCGSTRRERHHPRAATREKFYFHRDNPTIVVETSRIGMDGPVPVITSRLTRKRR